MAKKLKDRIKVLRDRCAELPYNQKRPKIIEFLSAARYIHRSSNILISGLAKKVLEKDKNFIIELAEEIQNLDK